MSQPQRPSQVLHEGPPGSCVIGGIDLSWTNCTPCGFAMGIDKATKGHVRPTTCEIRRYTADVKGGTSLPQNAVAVERELKIASEVHVGPSVATASYLASQLHAGRGASVQGEASVLIKTPFRSTKGIVNHNVYVNEGRGWTITDDGDFVPEEVLVYDPAADGRQAAWGTAASSPDWWPWALFLKFAAALRPWGETDGRTIGPNKIYCAIFADTEPHVHVNAKFGARALRTLPNKLRAYNRNKGLMVNVRSGPGTTYPVVQRLPVGARFYGFQVTSTGENISGSRVWVGDHNGNRWIHSTGVRA